MRRTLLSCLIWLPLALAAGCQTPNERVAAAETTLLYDEFDRSAMALDDVTSGLQNNASRGFVAGEQGAGVQRMLIEGGRAEVEVARLDEASNRFVEQVVAWGGHLQQRSSTAREDSVALTVRVPAEHFDAAFAALRAAGRMLSESRQAEDVTEEFVDLGIRLDTARKARDRLLEVLARADKVTDVLAVEKELRRLTEEIERMEGRRKFLIDRVALATLEVLFRSPRAAPSRGQQHRPNRFAWINLVGANRAMERY